jgi:hypothetical protein
MEALRNQIMKNSDILNLMSPEALRNLVTDIRAQVNLGLMSNSEAHGAINKISAIIMLKEMGNIMRREDNESYGG